MTTSLRLKERDNSAFVSQFLREPDVLLGGAGFGGHPFRAD